MPIDVVMAVSALVFGVIAGAYIFEGREARRQARALESDNRLHANLGIPWELQSRRPTTASMPRAKGKKRSA
jgi:hypothetical protein